MLQNVPIQPTQISDMDNEVDMDIEKKIDINMNVDM